MLDANEHVLVELGGLRRFDNFLLDTNWQHRDSIFVNCSNVTRDEISTIAPTIQTEFTIGTSTFELRGMVGANRHPTSHFNVEFRLNDDEARILNMPGGTHKFDAYNGKCGDARARAGATSSHTQTHRQRSRHQARRVLDLYVARSRKRLLSPSAALLRAQEHNASDEVNLALRRRRQPCTTRPQARPRATNEIVPTKTRFGHTSTLAPPHYTFTTQQTKPSREKRSRCHRPHRTTHVELTSKIEHTQAREATLARATHQQQHTEYLQSNNGKQRSSFHNSEN